MVEFGKPGTWTTADLILHVFHEDRYGQMLFLRLDSEFTYAPIPKTEPERSEHIGVVNWLNDCRQIIFDKLSNPPENKEGK